MFAGRSVERLVPIDILPRGKISWCCETVYRLIGPQTTDVDAAMMATLTETFTRFNAAPDFKIVLHLTVPTPAMGTQEAGCEQGQEDCFHLTGELAENYRAIDVHVLSGIVRKTQFPDIGEKEWTYNRMLETSLRDRGITVRVVSLFIRALPEGMHVMKHLPMTPLYGEETSFQLYGRELLPFDVAKQNVLYATLDLIGLNNLAGVGWIKIANVSESWQWMAPRWVGVANITIHTIRDRTGASMGECLLKQMPRLLDRLDEIGLPRVDGRVLWSRVLLGHTMQDQLTEYLDEEETTRVYETREPYSSIEAYPPALTKGIYIWQTTAPLVCATLLTIAGSLLWLLRRKRSPLPPPPESPFAAVGSQTIPSHTLGQNLFGIQSLQSVGPLLPSFPMRGSVQSDMSSDGGDSFNPFRKQRTSSPDTDINTLGDSATETAGIQGISEAKRRQQIQAEMDKAATLKGWEIPKSAISICKREDGSDWLLGHGGFGEVYKGLRSSVQDVAVKVLTISEELEMQQFWVEINLLKSLSYDRNIVQFYGCITDSPNPILILELMEGGDLRGALSGPLAEFNSWDNNGHVLAMDIVRGVFYLHDNRVIHGDLKSKNVLLSRNFGTAKLSDVGMSRVLASTFRTGDTQAPPGTFAYAAPELLLGQRCTFKADIFSLGVTLWEICTREVPVRGQLRDIRVPEECPQIISDLIESCRQPLPEDRPSAKQVFDVLKAQELRTQRSNSGASSNSFPTRLSVQRSQLAIFD